MNILRELQELDDLIIEHTKPPITAILRNKLAFCIEQATAHVDAVDRQSLTLSTQVETIERLVAENKAVVSQNAALIKKYETPDSDTPPIIFKQYGPSVGGDIENAL